GYLAGYAAATAPAALQAAPVAADRPLSILFLTESGNAEGVAADARKAGARSGFKGRLLDAAEVTPADLDGLESLLVIASTWGEGDPPERAVPFYRALMAEGAPRLDGLHFSVLALGDTSYVNFCEVGKRIDARLEELGGTRAAPRVDCDLDFEEPASTWIGSALKRLDELVPRPGGDGADVIHVDFHGTPGASAWSKSNPFAAEIQDHVDLNGSRSAKETIHLELSLAGSGLTFEPGDSIGIVPENDPAMVAAVLEAAKLDGDAALGAATIAAALATDFDITSLTRTVVEAYARLTGDAALETLVAGQDLAAYLAGRQIVDLLTDYPNTLTAEQLTGLLRKLPPRLYSVASSLKAHPDEAHLLVSRVRYESLGRERHGVASGHVADRLKAGDRALIYVKPNKYFRLPADPNRPVIMIGPGTGVAPFRAFLQERQAVGAGGRNWLFFGDRTYSHDFLYQLDWQELKADGVLSRIDVAFSRDQPEKVYVQHRMWQRRAELFAWLEEGAHLYVCGDEKAMAKDVDLTLKQIVVDAGGWSDDQADAYIADLKRAGRYQRDVY
ncbi:MAG: flavodoxin domain-containing protein, partial [Geminicoccaceae bacterium]|nr:flavodoxin domain-containing protein [Geminicoccaceae bacterium]